MFHLQVLPSEMEKLLSRPDISPHLSRIISASLSPMMERFVKDHLTKSLLQQSAGLHQELLIELRNDLHKMKTELAGWQNDTLRAQEVRSITTQRHNCYRLFL